LKLVYQKEDSDNWDFDIVAVHGLSELPCETWVHSVSAKGRVNQLVKEEARPGRSQRPTLIERKQPGSGGSEFAERDSLKAPNIDQVKYDPSSREVNWLEDLDMLPKAFPRARIFRYGYEWSPDLANSTLDAISKSVGDSLLSELVRIRAREKFEHHPKPLLFIGHDFGGIVIEYVLNSASESTDDKNQQSTELDDLAPPFPLHRSSYNYSYKDVISATAGVIFLATPFKPNQDLVARWKRLGIIFPKAFNSIASTSKRHNKEGERTGTEDSSSRALDLELISSKFVKLVKKEGFRVSCFYELLPSKDSILGKVIQTTS
jgi:hypothetical protein